MAKGRYGDFGGQYIPETLMNEIHRLEEAYEFYKHDKQFNDELNTLLREYAGRPSPKRSTSLCKRYSISPGIIHL